MIIPLSTPGEWYLEYLENGLWSALQSMGRLWPLIISTVVLLFVFGLAFFVPFPKEVQE